MLKPPEILTKLLNLANKAITDRDWVRLRFAVTPEEYMAIKRYCLELDGRFYSRIKGVPLIVENDALNPQLILETV